MRAVLWAVDPAEKPAIAEYGYGGDDGLDLDKAWHGLHFLLTGDPDKGDPPLAYAIMGAEELTGTGDALWVGPAEVAAVATALSAISDDDFAARFDAEKLTAASIYPGIWGQGERALGYLAPFFVELRSFYQDAAARGRAVVIVAG